MKNLIILFLLLSFQVNAEYILISAPRGDRISETKKFDPIAKEISKVIGAEVRYKYIGGWAEYTKALSDDKYDFVFNGPQFSSYLYSYKGHQFIARLEEPLSFVVIAKEGSRFNDIKSIAGRPVCLHPSPNLGTLLLLNNYTTAPPATILVEGFKNAFEGVVKGNCTAAVVPLAMFNKLNNGDVKIIHEFKKLPNQALTVSSRIPNNKVSVLRRYILDGKCQSCSAILETFSSKSFIEVDVNDYIGISDILSQDFILGKDIDKKLTKNYKF